MWVEYPHIFEDFGNLVDVVQVICTEDSAKIRGGDCNTPRMCPSCIYKL
jgi:hypothetical protein